MDRTMFPRTVVEIDLVLDLCDKQRYDLLAAVMSFCCRQTRSLVPCRDFKTMRVWCGVTPQWWARWGVQVVPLIPPLGGGAYGFMEIEAAWESHQKWADTNRIKGMKSGVARRIKKLRKPVKAVEPGNRTQCSTGDEQTQPQSQSHSPALATLYPKIGTSLAPGSLGGTPEPVPPVAGSLPLPQPPQAENGGEKLTALLNSIVEQNCREKRKNAESSTETQEEFLARMEAEHKVRAAAEVARKEHDSAANKGKGDARGVPTVLEQARAGRLRPGKQGAVVSEVSGQVVNHAGGARMASNPPLKIDRTRVAGKKATQQHGKNAGGGRANHAGVTSRGKIAAKSSRQDKPKARQSRRNPKRRK